jgi:hypothetical protein
MATTEELQAEMERLLKAGDAKALEAYTLKHFTELPEEVQGKVLMGFFTEALETQAGEAQIAQLQRQGLDAIEKIEALKREASSAEVGGTELRD